MRKTVSAMEARRKFGELLEGVYYRNDYVMIERKGKPMAALVPAERLFALDAASQRLSAFLAKPRGDDLSEDEAMRLALEAQQAVRRKARSSKRSA